MMLERFLYISISRSSHSPEHKPLNRLNKLQKELAGTTIPASSTFFVPKPSGPVPIGSNGLCRVRLTWTIAQTSTWRPVTEITGRAAEGTYSDFCGMKSTFKFAAFLLLLAFGVSAASAALPCQLGKRSSMLCGANCPMAIIQDGTASGSGNSASESSCCQRLSQPAATIAAQSVTEQCTPYAIQPDERIAPSLPLLKPPIDRSNARGTPRSRAALCTFLI